MTERPSPTRSLALLVASTVFMAFGQGHWPSGIMLIIGVALAARFFRVTRGAIAGPLFVVAHVVVWEWAYAGMVPLPAAARLGMEAGTGLVLAAVLLVHTWASRRLTSPVSTLVLPLGWVVYDFASARLSPGGTWGSVAYTFADDLVLAQLASLVGWTGITFMAVWVGAVIEWARANRAAGARARRALTVVALVVGTCLAYGAARSGGARHGDPIAVACVVPPNSFDDETLDDLWAYTRGVERPPASVARAVARINASFDEHFALVDRAAADGVELVVWPEANPVLTDAEEPALLDRARATAARHGIHLGMGMSVFRPTSGEPTLNRFVVVDPEGRIVIDFLKATRPPGAGHVKGDGVLPKIETTLGRLSAAICFDLDFPHLLGQAGAAGVDVFLAPANDWRAVRDTHARMARLRAVEQGFALVRPTKDGTTLITDATGRTVAALALDDNRTGLVFADLDPQRRGTLYAVIGDAFAWGCIIAFICLCALAARSKETS